MFELLMSLITTAWGSALPFIPVANVVADGWLALSNQGDLAWFPAMLKAYETVLFCQLMLPVLEAISIRTACQWDDGLFHRFANVVAFSTEIFSALMAVDPNLKKRLTDKRT